MAEWLKWYQHLSSKCEALISNPSNAKKKKKKKRKIPQEILWPHATSTQTSEG
jgi:hypothetical protein